MREAAPPCAPSRLNITLSNKKPANRGRWSAALRDELTGRPHFPTAEEVPTSGFVSRKWARRCLCDRDPPNWGDGMRSLARRVMTGLRGRLLGGRSGPGQAPGLSPPSVVSISSACVVDAAFGGSLGLRTCSSPSWRGGAEPDRGSHPANASVRSRRRCPKRPRHSAVLSRKISAGRGRDIAQGAGPSPRRSQ